MMAPTMDTGRDVGAPALNSRWEEHPYLPPGKDRKWLNRLHDSIDKSTRSMSTYREEWVKLIEYVAGNRYNGGRGSKYARPLNPLRMNLQTYVSRLSGEVPQCSVWAENIQLMPEAYRLEWDTNRTLRTTENLDEFHESAIMEAFIGASVAKVVVELTEQTVIDGVPVWKKRPTIELVDSEDVILDIASKRSGDIKYIGNRYMACVDDLLEDPNGDERCKDYIRRVRNTRRVDGPVSWEQQPLGVSNNDQHDQNNDLDDQIRMMDVYIPKKKWMLTLVQGAPHLPPFWGRRWYACDPYIPLYIERLSGNVLPVPVARHWYDLSRNIDNAYTKLMNQARRQKTVVEVPNAKKGDAEKLDSTPDGGAYSVDQKDSLREVRYGGPDQVNFAFAIHLKQLNNYVSNNIELIAGINSSSDTATEANIMSSGSNAGMASIERKIRNWWGKIMQAVAWFNYHDELHEPEIEYGDRKMGVVVYRPWSYAERTKYDFFKFMFNIKPHSNTYQTPEQKLAAIKRVLTEIYAPFMQLAAQQGVQLSMSDLFAEIGHLSNLGPELKNLLVRSDIPDSQPMTEDTGPFKANVPKIYTHQSRPSKKTQRGQEEVLMTNLLGSSRQPSEMAM